MSGAEPGDIREIGYIRSNCLTNALPLFPEGSVQRIVADRRTKVEEFEDDIQVPWFQSKGTVTRNANLDWDRKTHGGNLPTNALRRIIDELDLGEMVIQEIEFRFTDPKCVQRINDYYRGEESSPDFDYDEDTELFALFKSIPLSHIRGETKWVEVLHEEAKQEHNISHLGILRLEDFATLEGKTTFTEEVPEGIKPERVSNLIRCVFNNLDENQWDTECIDPDTGDVAHPSPTRINTEELSEEDVWIMQGEV